MRVVYVTSSLPYGPGEAFIIPEITELMRQGHEILVSPMYPRGAVIHGDAEQLMERVLTRSLFSRDVLNFGIREAIRNPARAARSLAWLLRTRNPKTLLKNLAVYPKGLWLARLARDWKAEHIHAHWAATTATMALVAGEVSGIPWSVTAHRWDIVENNLLDRKFAHAGFVRFISRSGLKLARSLGIEAPDEKTSVLHMGAVINLPKVRVGASKRSHSASPLVVVCPANMVPVKGHQYLIEAARILLERGVGVEVWLAGDGELRKALEEEVEARKLSHTVRFLGQLPHPELMRLYREQEVDLVVLPSLDLGNGEHEGIPVSLIEAMGRGIPVVSTTTGGIPELLEGGAGSLVPPADPRALADAVQELVEDPGLRQRLVRAGRERVSRSFAIDVVTTQLAACFEAHAKRRG